jgi:hypothetical protein
MGSAFFFHGGHQGCAGIVAPATVARARQAPERGRAVLGPRTWWYARATIASLGGGNMRERVVVVSVVLAAMVAGASLLAGCAPKEEASTKWVPSGEATAPAPAAAAPVKLFEITNIYGVRQGAKAPTFTLDRAATITEIMNYHYIVGGGPTPGTIGLKSSDGTSYGPWSCIGLMGQGNVKNATWDAKPNEKVPAGTYTVVDSGMSTWSTNGQAKGLGFVTVMGTFAN